MVLILLMEEHLSNGHASVSTSVDLFTCHCCSQFNIFTLEIQERQKIMLCLRNQNEGEAEKQHIEVVLEKSLRE